MSYVTIEQLLEAGAHFGHLTRRWNPQMRPFIYGERNGIHVIDLRKTQLLVDVAHDATLDIASKGNRFLFVGTKKQAKEAVQREAQRAGSYFVTERWLGGMLTNFQTIRKSIRRLDQIEKWEQDGTFEKFNKKERLVLNREREKLMKVFGGIREMTRLPGALVIFDIKKEHLAILEAKKLGIPIIAVVDTNCDPRIVEYPIPANDDSITTIELISKVLADAVIEGREIARMHNLDAVAEQENAGGEESAEPKKRMRKREGGMPNTGTARRGKKSEASDADGADESSAE
jgi:small subunit ribosomal protein S2